MGASGLRPRPLECRSEARYTHLAILVLAGNQMLAAAAYLLLSAIWRQRAFALMAAGSVAAYSLYELSLHGLAFQYLWPDATTWAPCSLLVLMGTAQLLQSL